MTVYSKNFVKHMSEQTHRFPHNYRPYDKWVGRIILTGIMLWVLRWPVLFIVFLITG